MASWNRREQINYIKPSGWENPRPSLTVKTFVPILVETTPKKWGSKSTPSFTPSSVPVLVPVPDLPQSHSVTTKTPDCLVLIRRLWHSILLNHSWSSTNWLGLRIWRLLQITLSPSAIFPSFPYRLTEPSLNPSTTVWRSSLRKLPPSSPVAWVHGGSRESSRPLYLRLVVVPWRER